MWQTAIVLLIVALALVGALRRATRTLRGQAGCACAGNCAKRNTSCDA